MFNQEKALQAQIAKLDFFIKDFRCLQNYLLDDAAEVDNDTQFQVTTDTVDVMAKLIQARVGLNTKVVAIRQARRNACA